MKEDTSDFEDVNILVPEYSRKFLEAIYEVENASSVFKRFASSIYANLKIANEERESMYQHFSNALTVERTSRMTIIWYNGFKEYIELRDEDV